jgi:hypothetical protein
LLPETGNALRGLLYNKSERQTVLDLERFDAAGSKAVEVIEQLAYLVLQLEILYALVKPRPVVATKLDLSDDAWGWIPYRFARADHETFDAPEIEFLHDLDKSLSSGGNRVLRLVHIVPHFAGGAGGE